jgi:hypothetical protein
MLEDERSKVEGTRLRQGYGATGGAGDLGLGGDPLRIFSRSKWGEALLPPIRGTTSYLREPPIHQWQLS